MIQDLPINTKLQEDPCRDCGKKTVLLYLHGSEYSGVYSCEHPSGCGSSWSCEHDGETKEEEHEVNFMRNGEPDQYEVVLTICSNCEESLDD